MVARMRFVTFIDTLSVLQGMVYILMDSEGAGRGQRSSRNADGYHLVIAMMKRQVCGSTDYHEQLLGF